MGKENKKNTRKKKDINEFTVPRRAMLFILRTVLILTIVITLAFSVFLTAMHTSNIYILVTEGMTLRAACIMGDSDPNEMYSYFNESFIKKDEAMLDNVYSYYDISSYDYRLSVDSIKVWPWNTTATMTVTERIPTIVGTAHVDAPSSAIPKYISAQYKIVCVKNENRWYITNVQLIKEVEDEKASATPNMELLPSPTAKPTETPLPEAAITETP